MTEDRFEVVEYGTDSSGRKILMTRHMARVWNLILDDPAVRPFAARIVIVQGAFMARVGGGARASAGVHDQAGCLDVRTWNLSPRELEAFIRTARSHGFAFWRRDHRHGMDPHAHGVLGTDFPLDPGAAAQWREYLSGFDGLSGSGRDYEWRPSPLVTRPPEEDEDMTPEQMEKLADMVADKVWSKAIASSTTDTGRRKASGMLTSIERLAKAAAEE